MVLSAAAGWYAPAQAPCAPRRPCQRAGTGDTLVFSGSGLDNGVWNFGLGYGIRGRLPLCIFFTEYLTAAKRADLRQQVSAQTGLSL